MIGAMPLSVIDFGLIAIEAKETLLRFGKGPFHALSLFSDDRARFGQDRDLPRHALLSDWDFYSDMETVEFSFVLSMHATRSLMIGPVPSSDSLSIQLR